MKKLYKNFSIVLTTVLLFSLSVLASAAGTNISSGFSTTTGTSFTDFGQHGNYSENGCGVTYSKSSNDDGVSVRRESYNIEIETETESSGTVSGQFESVNYSSGAGILATNMGTTEGTSTVESSSSSETYVEIDGNYNLRSRSNTDDNNSWNREHGTFSSYDHSYTETDSESVTEYSVSYSNTQFNY